ncbi:DMT family transporter [Dongia sp.]|uniref:DMT family transporter n=1 Tax=Dongia sp. TaxID=1977262 RepID=UPI0035B0B49C
MLARHIALLAFSQILWGANFAVVKWGLADWPPLFFAALRMIGVAALICPFVGLPKKQDLKPLLALGFVLGVIHFASIFHGIARVDAATSSILIQLQVPLSALTAAFLFGDKIGWRRWCGMALAFIGILVLVGRPAFNGGWLGTGFMLMASISWVASNILIKRLAENMDGWRINAWVALMAGPMMLVLSALTETGQVAAIAHAGLPGWGAMAYQILIVTALCYGIWYAMMSRYPVSLVMPFTLLEPIFGTATAVLLLGESWDWRLVLGAALTMSGLAIIIVRRPQVVMQPVGPGA